MRTIVIVCLLALTACGINKPVPLTNQVAAASKIVNDLALQIDRLQKQRIISDEREDKLLDQLLEVNKALRLASTLAASCQADCSNAEAQLRAANELLLTLQTEVNTAEKKQ